MTASELIDDIRTFCIANANDANVEKYSRFFKEAYIAYGLTQPQMNAKAKEIIKSKTLSLKELMKAMPDLLKSTKYEEISIALLIFNGYGKEFTKELFEIAGTWYSFSINNWAHADALGMFILPQFVKYEVIKINDFKPWLTIPFKFQRRSVPVTFIKSLKTAITFEPYFKFIEPLMIDEAREVHQGCGWFLREAWKKKPEETEVFLMKWKDRCPRLIIQYATERMTPENKARFKRVKS